MKLKSYLAIALSRRVLPSGTDEVSPVGRVINPMDTPSTALYATSKDQSSSSSSRLF